MAAKQVKSKQRVADHGEVFTAEREVKAMCRRPSASTPVFWSQPAARGRF